MNKSARKIPIWLKPVVFTLCLLPFTVVGTQLLTGSIGADPIESLLHETGQWALRMLLITLALSPLRQILNHVWPLLLRRMLGLFCFFYAFLHVCVYVLLDRSLDLGAVFEDLIKRPFITAGFSSFVLLVILAVTSNNASMKWLRKNWTRLHRWVYIATVLALLHLTWLAKADRTEAAVYLGIALFLFVWRVARTLKTPKRAAGGATRPGPERPAKLLRQKANACAVRMFAGWAASTAGSISPLCWRCYTSLGWPKPTAPKPRSISASPWFSSSGGWREP